MPSRPPQLLLAAGLTTVLATVLITACSGSGSVDRQPGDPVTREDARALAELLHRDFTRAGADFVITAPYGVDTVLTLTGEVDFRQSVGRAQAVTSFGDGRPDDARTLFFTADDVWTGDLPGLADALAAGGAPGAAYLRRPVTTGDDGGAPLLVDVVVTVLLNLSADTADDPKAFLGGGYTWEGQRSIDSRLTSLFGLADGRTVAVAATDDLLTQFVTPLAGGDVEVTVTLSDHGPRTLELPAEAVTAEAAEHADIAAAFGI
jgi:hypothetical protein